MKQIIESVKALLSNLKTFGNRQIPYWMDIPVMLMVLMILGLNCTLLATAIRENVLEYRLEMFRGLGAVWFIMWMIPTKKPA